MATFADEDHIAAMKATGLSLKEVTKGLRELGELLGRPGAGGKSGASWKDLHLNLFTSDGGKGGSGYTSTTATTGGTVNLDTMRQAMRELQQLENNGYATRASEAMAQHERALREAAESSKRFAQSVSSDHPEGPSDLVGSW